MNKEQELLTMIENIEKAYDTTSPFYKFRFVFYNKVDQAYNKPYDFPDELWYKSIRKDTTLMPVLLKGKEVEQRRVEQVELGKKLILSYNYVQDKIDELKLKADKIRNRIYNLLFVYRKIVHCMYNKHREKWRNCALMEDIEKINVDVTDVQYEVTDRRKDVLGYLIEMKDNLTKLVSRIEEDLYEQEKKAFVYANINRI